MIPGSCWAASGPRPPSRSSSPRRSSGTLPRVSCRIGVARRLRWHRQPGAPALGDGAPGEAREACRDRPARHDGLKVRVARSDCSTRRALPPTRSRGEGRGWIELTWMSVPEPDSKTQGLNLSPRLNFVPPPELPTPESASIQARAIALGIDALIGLAAFILLAILYGGISSSNGLLRIKISGPPLLMATVLWLGYMSWMEVEVRGLDRQACQGAPRRHGRRGAGDPRGRADPQPDEVPGRVSLRRPLSSLEPTPSRIHRRCSDSVTGSPRPWSWSPRRRPIPGTRPSLPLGSGPARGPRPAAAPPAGGGGPDPARGGRCRRLLPDAGCELGAHEASTVRITRCAEASGRPRGLRVRARIGRVLCATGLDHRSGPTFASHRPRRKTYPAADIPPSGEMDHRPIVGAWPRLEDMR